MAKHSSKGRNGSASSPSSASVARWETVDDIPMDAEEAFHADRDKVLLNGDGQDDDDEYEFGGDQREVLALRGSDIDSDDDQSGDDEQLGSDADADEAGERRPREYKRLEKERAAKAAAAVSDDEDVDVSDSEDEDKNLSRWGSNKRAYYNTNNLDEMDQDSEIDEEEARQMELNEVKKLQAKSRKGMEDSDFGLGEADEFGGAEQGGKGVKERERRKAELDGAMDASVGPESSSSTAQMQESLPSDPVARAHLLAQLHKESPETVALAGEFADAVDQLLAIKDALAVVERSMPDHPAMGMMHMHYQALYTYVTTLTFYFHLRASPPYCSDPARLSQHPVLPRLLQLKEGLTTMEDMGFAVPFEALTKSADDGDEDDEDGNEEEGSEEFDSSLAFHDQKWAFQDGSEEDSDDLGDLDDDELNQLIADEKENAGKPVARVPSGASPAAGVAKTAKAASKGKDTAAKAKTKKQARREREEAQDIAPLADLADDHSVDLNPTTTRRKNAAAFSATPEDGTAFGEATSLSAAEAEDKAAKKKSLRFYTGQMDAKEARRGQAARDRMGGDSDIPYRDRDRSRQAVEAAKAAREGKLNKDGRAAALDDEEWGEGDTRDWKDVMGLGGGAGSSEGGRRGAGGDGTDDDDGDYYDLVASGRKEAKRAKKDEYDAARDEARIIDETDVEPGSHRAINRQISTNRGLTPHRKQDRNLRVKKRKKYEKAQKKLSSTRAVYKGGQAALQGGYQGESSGINTAVAKSRRFAN